jgi:hypothetical protein
MVNVQAQGPAGIYRNQLRFTWEPGQPEKAKINRAARWSLAGFCYLLNFIIFSNIS